VRFSAIIFDLDGTLLDTLADIGESMNAVLDELGMPVHPLESYRGFVGDGVVMLARRALPPERADEATVAKTAARMREIYASRATVRTAVYEGLPALLDALERRGLPKAVLSNKPHDLTVSLVRSMLGRWSFHPVLGERAGVPRKPDPHAALEIAEALAVSPRSVLFLGDTATDMATARSAGMTAVGALWGFRDAHELVQAGASTLVARPGEVLRLL